MTSSLPPGGGAHTRALKVIIPTFPPVGGGAVVTNDQHTVRLSRDNEHDCE